MQSRKVCDSDEDVVVDEEKKNEDDRQPMVDKGGGNVNMEREVEIHDKEAKQPHFQGVSQIV